MLFWYTNTFCACFVIDEICIIFIFIGIELGTYLSKILDLNRDHVEANWQVIFELEMTSFLSNFAT